MIFVQNIVLVNSLQFSGDLIFCPKKRPFAQLKTFCPRFIFFRKLGLSGDKRNLATFLSNYIFFCKFFKRNFTCCYHLREYLGGLYYFFSRIWILKIIILKNLSLKITIDKNKLNWAYFKLFRIFNKCFYGAVF